MTTQKIPNGSRRRSNRRAHLNQKTRYEERPNAHCPAFKSLLYVQVRYTVIFDSIFSHFVVLTIHFLLVKLNETNNDDRAGIGIDLAQLVALAHEVKLHAQEL